MPRSLATEPDVHFFDDGEERPRKVKKRIKNPGLLAAGIVVAASGPTLILVGLFTTSCNRSTEVCHNEERLALFGLGGLALIGAGIPLIIVGARREPVRQVTLAAWPARHGGGLSLRLDL